MNTPPSQPEPLSARAPRPPVVRLRRGAALILVLGAASLVGGALCWSFVAAPQLRAAQRKAAAETPKETAPGKVLPTELVTSQPASYDRLAATLPQPRVLGQERDETRAPARPPRSASAPPRSLDQAKLARDEARRAPLLVAVAAPARSVRPRPQESAPGPAAPPAQTSTSRPTFELKAGSIIAARLQTAVDTSRPGPVVAIVSTDVFDTTSGRHLLVAQGSRLIGRYDGASRYGDRRAFLTWERLILADGRSLELGGEPGVDAQGASGVIGKIDRRLGQLSLGILFSGAITAIGQAARGKGDGDADFFLDVGDAAAIEAARVGGKLVDRELQVSPSIRLEPGAAVRVLLTRDLILEAPAP